MSLSRRWAIGWWAGAGLVLIVMAPLAGPLHRIVGRILRSRDKAGAGTLELISGNDDAKFEIIAVPGLGADPFHTWTQANPRYGEPQNELPSRVHLLRDLLASDFPEARILNFNHDSGWLIDAPVKTTEEIGACLLREIKNRRLHTQVPIIFIGHSLGGILIKQALVKLDAEEIVEDASGIIFLGTPHLGSSNSTQGVVLAWMTAFLGSNTNLLLPLQNNSPELSNLNDKFTACIARKQSTPLRVISFYETKNTYILGLSLGLVVSRDSATRHASVGEAHSIETDHSGLNKCATRTDSPYANLKSAICRLRSPSLLEQADAFIRRECYTADRLKIERLSGDPLDMDQCYINLAIVEQSRQDAVHSGNGPTPFSLLARQNVEEPDESVQVQLAALFSQGKQKDGRLLEPRRILIRGRAGVGKTTLCKKIIHEFSRGTWSDWNKRFDRILWVPLRNLKLQERRQTAAYNFEHLFSHEYFSLPTSRPELARRLSDALEFKGTSTLFILDGLDEVSRDLGGNDDMARFLDTLLRYRNVIITSRPNATHPALQNLDLELETIGFYPDQVHDYINKTFIAAEEHPADKEKVEQVRFFLDKHWVIQGLARIPIQLDALCYTWDDPQPEAIPNTMTGMYREIEQKLWKKDSVRLGKKSDADARLSRPAEIRNCIKDELEVIQHLAFSGLQRDIIDFTPAHRDEILATFPQLQLHLPLDETLDRLSFLRFSDPSSKNKERSYHFIHLTFQEYFAALYFVQQWKNTAKLRLLALGGDVVEPFSPIEFLQKQKYTARYDIFWRFVAGMLDMDGRQEEFINAIEEEPLDLLGPTHQRLVMHCLSEISSNWPMREKLTQELGDWLSFDCTMYERARLLEVEFPDQVLKVVLQEQSAESQEIIMNRIKGWPYIPPSVFSTITSFLQSDDKAVRRAAIEALDRRDIPNETLMAVAVQLDDEDNDIISDTLEFLGRRAVIPGQILGAMISKLRHNNSRVREAAIGSLSLQEEPSNQFLEAVAARLDEEPNVRSAAVRALGHRAAKPSKNCTDATAFHETQNSESGGILRFLAAQLGDSHRAIRDAARGALSRQTSLSDEILRAIASFLCSDIMDTRESTVEFLGRLESIPDEILHAMVPLLIDQSDRVRIDVGEALGDRKLPVYILRAIVLLLHNQNSYARPPTIEVPGCQGSISNDILSAMVPLRNNQISGVQFTILRVLSHQVPLPEEILRALLGLLGSKDPEVQISAIKALSPQLIPSKDIPVSGVAQKKDENTRIGISVDLTEDRPGVLPSKILAAIATLLDSDDWLVRYHALDAFRRPQSMLSDKILTAVAARLKDETPHVRYLATAVLAVLGRGVLSSETVMSLAHCMDDSHALPRHGALGALSEQQMLSDEILMAVVAQLDEGHSYIQDRAEALLRRHEKFYGGLMGGPRFVDLYPVLLRGSFEKQLSLYMTEDNTCLNFSDGTRVISVATQGNKIREMIQRARPANHPISRRKK